MRSGALREVITIQRPAETLNAYGTPELIWGDVATLRAELVRQEAEELIRSQGAVDEEMVVFRTRYLEGVTAADRVMWRGRAFNLKSVAELGRRRGLELRAVAAGGG